MIDRIVRRSTFMARTALWVVVSSWLCLSVTFAGGVVIGPGPVPVPIDDERPFIRGDANVDGMVDLGDAIRILDFLFPTMPSTGTMLGLSCRDAGDANDDEAVDLSDAIYVLGYLFSGAPPPPAPFPNCGDDPTSSSALTCINYGACPVDTDLALAGHLLRRLAYGPTPDELERVQAIGADAYIAEQLQPELLDDSDLTDFQSIVAALNPTTDRNDLYELQLARGLYSKKQLLEQLVDFWNNHFNTYYWTVRNYFRTLRNGSGVLVYTPAESLEVATLMEYLETESFREAALGSFQGLVERSATSVAMLIYLDNITNVVGNANENYARELLELHCMGVDNGYDQEDIEEVARCFTGWTVCRKAPVDVGDPLAPCLAVDDPAGEWTFHFDAAQHDYGEKVIFAGTPYQLVIPASTPGDAVAGLADGFLVLEHVAGLQQTAEFVSTKLIQKFVDDEVPPALLAACIGAWLSTDGDLRAVLEAIFTSDQFLGDTHRWSKLETPMESLLSTVRAFGGQTNTVPVRSALGALNHLPFNFQTPDGFPEIDSLGTSKLLERLRFNARIYHNTNPSYDLVALVADHGIAPEDPAAIVEFFLTLLYQENYSPEELALGIDYLSTDDFGVPQPLVASSSDYDDRLEKVAAFLASFPQGTQQ